MQINSGFSLHPVLNRVLRHIAFQPQIIECPQPGMIIALETKWTQMPALSAWMGLRYRHLYNFLRTLSGMPMLRPFHFPQRRPKLSFRT